MASVQIPPSLRRCAGDQETLQVPGATVQDVLTALRHRFPELGRHLLKDDGGLRSYVNLFVNGQDVRSLQGASTGLAEADVLTLVPSIAGG